MLGSVGGIALGVLVGFRHAFEPDHLTAVSTLVSEAGNARRGALLGAVWGIGHTISLVAVGVALLALDAALPARLAAGFELGVSVMLIALGARSIIRSFQEGSAGPIAEHHHGGHAHTHAGPSSHVHLGARTLAWRPLLIGLVHGLAGSGALTALVFERLPDAPARIVYMTLFGAGSVGGMAIASGLAGASLRAFAGRRARRILSLATGMLAIAVGIGWAIPMVSALV